ncbi:MAG: hypothetical protein HYY13_02965 [Nitrospirae bacterium]|nr:hypothetical protein [Nitrospirota bacterium]
MRGSRPTEGFDEAVRYHPNARELLSRCQVEDDLMVGLKPVQEALGTFPPPST